MFLIIETGLDKVNTLFEKKIDGFAAGWGVSPQVVQ
jgi:hypothetical protein